MNDEEGVGSGADSQVGLSSDEAALFMATLAALQSANDGGSAQRGLIEDAEPMEATCTVERSDE